ncbi:MAG: hypothetical protein O2779_04395 [Nanoarchaeota archaeon]|nr:hypothetical protein [Nanoarchaeota archaeon]
MKEGRKGIGEGSLQVEGNPSGEPVVEAEEVVSESKIRSDFIMIAVVIAIVVTLGLLFGFNRFSDGPLETIDDLHDLNQQGKLKKEAGDIYNGFSFVFLDGLWYTQVASKDGSALFDVPFHNLPTHVKDVSVSGDLNSTIFDAASEIYVTFDPLGSELQYVALAVGKFDQTLLKAYGKTPKASCNRNETTACVDRPIVTCNSTSNAVMSIEETDSTGVVYDDNCIIVRGRGPALVRSMERLLYSLYGIMS